MDTTPALGFWWRFLALLAVEMSLIVVAAFACQCFTKSAMWRRAIWQAAVLGALVLLLCELTGASRVIRAMISSGRTGVPAVIAKKQPSFLVTVTDSPMIPGTSVSPNSSARIPTAARPGETRSWWPGILWCAGFGVLLARILLVRSVFLLFGHRQRPVNDIVLDARVQELATQLRIRRHIRIREIAELRAPIAFGVFRPTIGLPEGFCDSFTPKQRDVMLIHELAHLASRDAAWYWMADVLAAVFWWHPLGWWMRGRLHAATEAAADEACLLVEDGPMVLAESLVQLGGCLLQPARTGSLSIECNGFRSSLGRRVDRLISLHGRKWSPASRLRSALVKAVGPILFATLAIGALIWTFPTQTKALDSDWRDSVAARAFASVSQLVGNESASRATSLIGDAKIFFQAGKLEIAEALLDEALKIDPTNKEALNDLNLVHEARTRNRMQVDQSPPLVENKGAPRTLERILPADASRKDTLGAKGQTLTGEGLAGSLAESSARTNVVHSGKGRRAIYSKLESIRLATVIFDNVPLGEVVKSLADEVRKRDPEGRGIDFTVSMSAASMPPAPIDPATGLPLGPQLEDTLIKILPALDDITVAQALDAIVKVANYPIRFSVEEQGVVFYPRTGEVREAPVLHTRTFKLDPGSFARAMSEVALLPDYNQPQQKEPISRGIDRQERVFRDISARDKIDVMRRYFLSLGVDLTPPKALFYGDRLGIMFVRAPLEDLDVIEKALQVVLNIQPPQLTIEVRIAEMPESARKALGLDWLGAPEGAVASSISTNQSSNSLVATSPGATNCAIVLTAPQYRLIDRALGQRAGVDLLAAPRVTTLSARQAQIKVVEVKTVLSTAGNPASESSGVVDLLKTKEEFGPVIDVIPVVDADGYTIWLTVIVTIREFLGYDPTTETVKVVGDDGNVQSMPKPQPRFRVSRAMAVPVLWDGQTVAMELGTFDQKLRIAFITPTIIDPAGNRVHNEDENSPRMRSIPPQRKSL